MKKKSLNDFMSDHWPGPDRKVLEAIFEIVWAKKNNTTIPYPILPDPIRQFLNRKHYYK